MTCRAPDCDRKPDTDGWCRAHWKRIERTGDPQIHKPIADRSTYIKEADVEPRYCLGCGVLIERGQMRPGEYMRRMYCSHDCHNRRRAVKPCVACGAPRKQHRRPELGPYCTAACRDGKAHRVTTEHWVPPVETPCKGMDISRFIPPQMTPELAEAGAHLCRTCPVISDCFAAGRRQKESGIWGGVVLAEGRPIRHITHRKDTA